MFNTCNPNFHNLERPDICDATSIVIQFSKKSETYILKLTQQYYQYIQRGGAVFSRKLFSTVGKRCH